MFLYWLPVLSEYTIILFRRTFLLSKCARTFSKNVSTAFQSWCKSSEKIITSSLIRSPHFSDVEAKRSTYKDTDKSNGEENVGEPKGHDEIVIEESNLACNTKCSEASEEAKAKGSANNDTGRSKVTRDTEENVLEPKRYSGIYTQKLSSSANNEIGKEAEAKGSAGGPVEVLVLSSQLCKDPGNV